MANEISLDYGTTGLTLYALIFNAVGQIWNGATFETPLAANWATYATTMSEQSTTGFYAGTFPVVAAGEYSVSIRRKMSGSVATTDPVYGAGQIAWGGTAVIVPTGSGSGAFQYTITVQVSGVPKDNVTVWVTTDNLGVNVIASGQTDSNGNVTFQLDAGNYYAWCELGGDAFPNPTAITVP